MKISLEISVPQLGGFEKLVTLLTEKLMSAIDELGTKIDTVAATAAATNTTVEAMFAEIETLKQSVIDGITPEGKAFLDAKLDALAAMVGTIATPNT